MEEKPFPRKGSCGLASELILRSGAMMHLLFLYHVPKYFAPMVLHLIVTATPSRRQSFTEEGTEAQSG